MYGGIRTLEILLVVSLTAGCNRAAKREAEKARADVEPLATEITARVDALKQGVSEAAPQAWTVLVAKDAKGAGVPLSRLEGAHPSLTKGGKFAYVACLDDAGKVFVIDNEWLPRTDEPWPLLVPDLAKALPGGTSVSTVGHLRAPLPRATLEMLRAAEDKDLPWFEPPVPPQWITAAPITGGPAGAAQGILLAAIPLEQLTKNLTESLEPPPGVEVTVGIFVGNEVTSFGGDWIWNAKEMSFPKLTKDGVATGTFPSNRHTPTVFGFAAKRVPALGDDAGVIEVRAVPK